MKKQTERTQSTGSESAPPRPRTALRLDRETLRRLTSAELRGVAGGSVRTCPPPTTTPPPPTTEKQG